MIYMDISINITNVMYNIFDNFIKICSSTMGEYKYGHYPADIILDKVLSAYSALVAKVLRDRKFF